MYDLLLPSGIKALTVCRTQTISPQIVVFKWNTYPIPGNDHFLYTTRKYNKPYFSLIFSIVLKEDGAEMGWATCWATRATCCDNK